MKDKSIKTEEDASDASDRLLVRGDGKTRTLSPRVVNTSERGRRVLPEVRRRARALRQADADLLVCV